MNAFAGLEYAESPDRTAGVEGCNSVLCGSGIQGGWLAATQLYLMTSRFVTGTVLTVDGGPFAETSHLHSTISARCLGTH